MISYYSTFITGFGAVVKSALINSLKNVKVELLADGLIVYKTSSSPNAIQKIKFLNNSFVLLKKVDNLTADPINDMMQIFLYEHKIENYIRRSIKGKRVKFRIRASIKNQFVSIDKDVLKKLEKKVEKISEKLQLDRSLPDIEFLLNVRSEGFGLIGLRFTHRGNYEKILEKGEIYPALASILCLISEPNKNDIFLDPFAGYGSIPKQRTFFPFKQIIACDKDEKLVMDLSKKLWTRDDKVVVNRVDAYDLKDFKEDSISKIVTDPPWGLYNAKNFDVNKYYSMMLQEFCRIVRPKGLVVILTAQKELLETIHLKFVELELMEKYNTLVSGKKAGV